MKILIAEDTRDLNRALTAVLSHEGYEVSSAHDGAEAQDMLEKDRFDAVILDIMMPKKNGLEVLKWLRGRDASVPVLLLTARAEIEDRVTGLDLGADDYLTKPFAMKELLARVRSMTRKRDEAPVKELTFGDLVLVQESLELVSGNTIRLSSREFSLMRTLILNSGREMATDELIKEVWENDPEADGETVWLYISYLRGKLMAVGSAAHISGERGGSFILSM